MNLPLIPAEYEPLEGVKPVDTGPNGLKRVMATLGEQGMVGVFVTSCGALGNVDSFWSITIIQRSTNSGLTIV